jgi:phage I-like protein
MKLSKIKQQELYDAIATQIVNLRIKAMKVPGIISHAEADEWLFKLEQDIWKQIKMVLKLK